MRQHTRTCAVAIAVLALAAPVCAQDRDRAAMRLEVRASGGAAQCGGAEPVREAIAARLGYDPFVVDAPRALQIDLDGSARQWRAVLRLTRAGDVLGERTIESRSRSCEPFLTDIALAASVAIDAYVREEEAEATPVAEPVVSAPTEPPAAPSVPPAAPAITTVVGAEESEAARGPDVRLALGLGALGAWGTAPDLTFGLSIWAHARWPNVSVGLEARADLPRSISAGPGRVEAFVVFATAAGCAHLAPVAACVLVGGGALRGEGIGLLDPARVTAPYAVAGGSVQARVELVDTLSLVFRADVLATLTRIVLLVDGVPVWGTEPLSVALSVGIEWAT